VPGGLDDFQNFRAESNQEIFCSGHLGMKRIFARDHQTYQPGALGTKTKELLGLVASAVLRCDDCTTYHLAANRIGTGTSVLTRSRWPW
jgi:AhpD family alkylhydroperoxidase